MTNSNRIKLTWISFLSYALTGALVIVTGMGMGNIADYFNLPVSSMSNTFTFLNAGILISIFLNAWLMEIVPLKTQLRFGFLLMVLAVAGLMFSHSLALFSAAMFILGVVSGITMVFMPSVTTFFIPRMLGGGNSMMFGDLIESKFLTEGSWNVGSALSLIMMLLILLSLSILRKADPNGEGGGMV